jgi:hypothetical protein
MGIGLSIAGRKRNDGIDFYQTPKVATLKLLEKETFNGSIIEPCSGQGAIAKVLEGKGYHVTSCDIRNDDDVYGEKGIDIFSLQQDSFSNVITNPPYFIGKEVVEKSLEIATDKVCMLLKLTFLESAKRYSFFKSSPLARVHVFSNRVTMYPFGTEEPKNGGTITFAWFVWEKNYIGHPTIDWII